MKISEFTVKARIGRRAEVERCISVKSITCRQRPHCSVSAVGLNDFKQSFTRFRQLCCCPVKLIEGENQEVDQRLSLLRGTASVEASPRTFAGVRHIRGPVASSTPLNARQRRLINNVTVLRPGNFSGSSMTVSSATSRPQ